MIKSRILRYVRNTVLIGMLSFSFAGNAFAYSITGYAHFSGYAWSDTIGWIDMSTVTIDPATGVIYGFAWSDNIGWVSFNALDVSGCPTAPCAPKLTATGISGWARAISGGTAQSGGWDGFIDLSSVARSSATALSGYAWGSIVVGWVDMSGVTLEEPPKVTVTLTTYLGGNKVYTGETVTLNWIATNNPTSCNIEINGAPFGIGIAYPSIKTKTVPNVTADATYKVTCTNGRPGSGSVFGKLQADPDINAWISTPIASPVSSIAAGDPFTVHMTSSNAEACRFGRIDDGVVNFANASIPGADGGPLSYNHSNPGWPGPHNHVWTFTCGLDLNKDGIPDKLLVTKNAGLAIGLICDPLAWTKCVSPANMCGYVDIGMIQCDGITCSANVAPDDSLCVPGACNPLTNGVPTPLAPKVNLCNTPGPVSPVTSDGTNWNWSCPGNPSKACSAPVTYCGNGICEPKHGETLTNCHQDCTFKYKEQ